MTSRRDVGSAFVSIALPVALMLAAACGAAHPRAPATAAATVTVFELRQVGSDALESRSKNRLSCSLRPFWGRMVLAEGRWSTADSLFINCPSSGGPGELHAREGSGRFEHAGGDTIEFFVADSTLGFKGYVFSAVLRGDVLRLIAAAEDGGDFVYRRTGMRAMR